MKIKRYTSEDMPLWDAFVKASRNGTFLHERGYMDYHSDRFEDHSLMYYDEKGKLIAVLPANISSSNHQITKSSNHPIIPSSLISHSGLTFAGFILAKSAKSSDVLELFDVTLDYLKQNGIETFVYKPAPTIYHLQPSQDEEYALWQHGAQLDVCNLAVSIDLRSQQTIAPTVNRSRCLRKALREDYTIVESDDLAAFWPIVTDNLMQRYGATPLHTLAEITLLKQRFPHNIRLWVALDANQQIQGGILIYETQQVAHCQYPHATAVGKAQGAIDLLYHHIIDYYINEKPAIRYFDFGTSNEQRGRYLNKNLISFKEGFGARGVTYKTYLIDN